SRAHQRRGEAAKNRPRKYGCRGVSGALESRVASRCSESRFERLRVVRKCALIECTLDERTPDAARGEQARLDGGPDAFAAAVIGKPGRIADENESIAADRAAAVGPQEIGMARHFLLRRAPDPPARLEVRQEIVDA